MGWLVIVLRMALIHPMQMQLQGQAAYLAVLLVRVIQTTELVSVLTCTRKDGKMSEEHRSSMVLGLDHTTQCWRELESGPRLRFCHPGA